MIGGCVSGIISVRENNKRRETRSRVHVIKVTTGDKASSNRRSIKSTLAAIEFERHQKSVSDSSKTTAAGREYNQRKHVIWVERRALGVSSSVKLRMTIVWFGGRRRYPSCSYRSAITMRSNRACDVVWNQRWSAVSSVESVVNQSICTRVTVNRRDVMMEQWISSVGDWWERADGDKILQRARARIKYAMEDRIEGAIKHENI